MTELQKFLILYHTIKENGELKDNLEGYSYMGIDAFSTDGGMIRVIKLSDLAIQQNYDNTISYFGRSSEQDLDDLLKITLKK
jgi:hypothetical protein